MATTGYEICLMISVLVLIYMAAKNYENVNIYDWTMVILVPVILMAYWLKTRVHTSEGAELANCFAYLDGSVLLTISVFAMLNSLNIHVKGWLKLLGYGAALAHGMVLWNSFGTRLYYSHVDVVLTEAGSMARMVPGPLQIVHKICLVATLAVIIGILIYAHVKKPRQSKRLLYTYASVAIGGMILYAIEYISGVNFSLLPYLYAAAVVLIVINYDLGHLHNIAGVLSHSQKANSQRGYVILDLEQRFMSCNEKAMEFLPFLKEQMVDEDVPDSEPIFAYMIDAFQYDGITSRKFQAGDRTCICEMDEISLSQDGKAQGYIFDIRDATEEQRVLDVMNSYNETLNREVEQKTRHIIDIQQKITIGMANIIENRDNNTGGHVKRTSKVVKILVEEIQRIMPHRLTEQLAEDIVRAAPMHDLGKVTIDSHILCKPGRLTQEEYKIMKTHSTKSGEMVRLLLEGVEEKHFVDTAYNIARFHHERWDGKGYPEGLVGTMIPLEARIMAVADVYDALVSRRCYKEPMSYAQAKEIMCQAMGTQFDPHMEIIFLNCLDRLEEYYEEQRRGEEMAIA